MIETEDTIVAIATPTAPAPRGAIRLSGTDTLRTLTRMGLGRFLPESPRRACRFNAPIDLGTPLGSITVSVLLWPTTRSYTGQPSAEIHTIGSQPLLRSLVDAAIDAGARAARPGEFTMRAFLNGRLDLTQAEAVLGVIEAEGRRSLETALSQLAGNLSQPLETLRSDLLDLLADVEAGLDFVDEDIEFISDEDLIERLQTVSTVLEQTAKQLQRRGGGAQRSTVAICGLPNAGKSSLINRLVGHEVSIVTNVAGTTRDSVTVECELGEIPVTLIDTAGLDESLDPIVAQSQQQTDQKIAASVVRVWCVDGSQPDWQSEAARLRSRSTSAGRKSAVDIWVETKSDLSRGGPSTENAGVGEEIRCSSFSGQGMAELTAAIVAAIARHDREEVDAVLGTAARCQQSIQHARRAIATATELTENHAGHEFVAAELRTCVECLGEVTGAVYTDDILDRVFGRFCIGK